MKYITIIIVSIIFFSCHSSYYASQPEISNGVLDLASYDFEKSGTVDLDGKWEFYWLRLYTSEDFKNIKHPQPVRFFEMPGAWNQKNRISDKTDFGSLGHATYRLLIKVKDTPDITKKYGLSIMEMNCSYNLFINGRLISSNGTVSDNSETMKPHFFPKIIFFNTNSNIIEIILQISNYVDNKGGSLHSIILGQENKIIIKKEKSLIPEVILFGILLIMGMYHFLIYFFRKRDISILYFGLICLSIAARVALTGERFLYLLFYDLNWELFVKFEYLSIFFIALFITLFINSLFRKDINRYIVYIFLIITVSFIIIIIPSPAIIFSSIIISYLICFVVQIIYLLSVIIRAYINKRELALLMLTGYFFLLLTALNDILNYLGFINSGNFLHLGMVLFILCQSIVLSLKFNNTFTKIISLSDSLILKQKNLEEKKIDLDKKVIDRTRIINTQNEEIENQIFMAESIQKSILPQSTPVLNGIKIAFIYKPMMKIGGDFVDYIIKNEKEIGFFICDVSGHGVPGAFLSSMVKMELMNNWYENLSSPGKVLTNIYNSISKNLGGNFITAAVSYLNIETGKFLIANAGHPSTIYLFGNREIKTLKPQGKAIVEYFKPDYEEIEMNIQPGAKIFMYTDGIIESFNTGFKQYGENNLIEFLKQHSELEVQNLCDAVLQEVLDFTGGENKFNDDVTMLAFEYTGKQK